MNNSINIAGLNVNPLTKRELLDELADRMHSGNKTFITTLYSEFLLAAMRDREVLNMLNRADIAVADGIAILWAAKFLQRPLTAGSYYGKILQAFWQVVYTGAAIIVRPRWIRSVLPEKIVGANLIWDLARLAAEKKCTIFLLGGFGGTPKLVAEKLTFKHPHITIAGYSDKNPDDASVIGDINKAAPDFLFVAYGPIRQEQWIASHLDRLPSVKLAIGLGGTFDYIAGKHKSPPAWMRNAGLEWLYRLVTQPRRVKRIWNATAGLITALVRFKVFSNLPFRNNVVCAIVNDRNEILIVKRNPGFPNLKDTGNTSHKKFADYWELPKGGIDDADELPEEAARREAWEELGIQDRDLRFIKISGSRHSYVWNQATRPLIGNAYHHKGQEQTVVYFKFTGNPKSITVDRFENAEFKWVPIERLENSIHEERAPIARIVKADFKVSE